jgi:hypothetical protein
MAHKHWVWHPQDAFIVDWQMTVATAIMYSTIMVPYRIGFDSDPEAEALYLDVFVDCLFFLDILLTFRTAYHNTERQLIFDLKSIARKYLKVLSTIDHSIYQSLS